MEVYIFSSACCFVYCSLLLSVLGRIVLVCVCVFRCMWCARHTLCALFGGGATNSHCVFGKRFCLPFSRACLLSGWDFVYLPASRERCSTFSVLNAKHIWVHFRFEAFVEPQSVFLVSDFHFALRQHLYFFSTFALYRIFRLQIKQYEYWYILCRALATPRWILHFLRDPIVIRSDSDSRKYVSNGRQTLSFRRE